MNSISAVLTGLCLTSSAAMASSDNNRDMVLVQGKSAEAAEQRVIALGGEVTDMLGIVSAVGTRPDSSQLLLLQNEGLRIYRNEQLFALTGAKAMSNSKKKRWTFPAAFEAPAVVVPDAVQQEVQREVQQEVKQTACSGTTVFSGTTVRLMAITRMMARQLNRVSVRRVTG